MPELTFRAAVIEFLEAEGFGVDNHVEEDNTIEDNSIDVIVRTSGRLAMVRIDEEKGQARICGVSICLADPSSLQRLLHILRNCEKNSCNTCDILWSAL
jgi:hypothetical protein